MGYIYKITNVINGKLYIGKTESSIQERWKNHCNDSTKRILEKRPLYNAINKYGKENFTIEEIEECDSNILEEREIFWINKFDSYRFGYNATLGGDGKTLFDYNKICSMYLDDNLNMVEISKILNCSVDTVSTVLKSKNISTKTGQEMTAKKTSIPVAQYSKDGVFLRNFPSSAEAARWLEENKFVIGNLSGVRTHIRDVVSGKRKTAHGFIWRNI